MKCDHSQATARLSCTGASRKMDALPKVEWSKMDTSGVERPGVAAVSDWGDDVTKPAFKVYNTEDVPLTDWGCPINAADVRLQQLLEMQAAGIIPKRGDGPGVFIPKVLPRQRSR